MDGAAKGRRLPTELCDNFKVRDEQSRQYHFQGSKVCHLRISLRPKIKEKPNNHISIGEGAWSCVSLFVTWWCGSWTIFHLRKWIVSFVYIYVFIYHSFHIHSWNIIEPYLTQSIGIWCILAGSPSAPSPSPSLATPVATFYGSPWYLTMYVDLQGRFLGCLLFYPFTEILHLLVKAPICLATVPLMKLIYLRVLILNKFLKAKTLRSLNSWWTLSIDRQLPS